MTDAQQLPLYHEDIYESLRTAVMALGGSKKVGGQLWPELSPGKAGEKLASCLNVARPEKLDAEQVLLIMREARKIGCHAVADFIGADAGYKFVPIEPEDEKAELQRQVIAASKVVADAVEKLSRLHGGGQ